MGMFGLSTKKDKIINQLTIQNQALIQKREEPTAVASIRGIEIQPRNRTLDESYTYYVDGVQLNVGLGDSEIDSANIDMIYKLVPIYAACVDGISREISNNQLSVVPVKRGKKGSEKEKNRIEELFRHPNVNWQSMSSFLYEQAEDTLNYGKNVIEKCFAKEYPDILMELWTRSADQFFEKKDKHGVITGYEQRIGEKKDWVSFKSHEILMTKYNSRAKKHQGKPMIEGILSACNIIIKSLDFIVRTFDYNEIPPGILWVKGAKQSQINDIKNKFKEKGKKGGLELLITMIGGDFDLIQWITLKQSIQDLEMLEHINNAERIIYNRFGVSSDVMSDIGDVNKATATVMGKIRSSQLINPITRIIEDSWNEEIVYPHLSENWKTKLEPQAEKTRAQILEENKILIPLGCKLINQGREDLGYDPVEGGDETIYVVGSRILRVRDFPEGNLNPQLNPYQESGESNNETGFNADEPIKDQTDSQKLENAYNQIWDEKKPVFVNRILDLYYKDEDLNPEISQTMNYFYKKMELAVKSIYENIKDDTLADYMNKIDNELLDSVKKGSFSFKNIIRNTIKDYQESRIEDRNMLAIKLNNAYMKSQSKIKDFLEIK